MNLARWLAALPVIAVLAVGCTAVTREAARGPDTPGAAPPGVADGAPEQTVAPREVIDAIPRPDPILALGNSSPYSVDGQTYEIMEEFEHYRERGIASWYGTKFHGRKTSNGEVFDLYAATAAHKTLPIPCYARVTNLANGRSIVVRVNDRGPFHDDRLIDLSYGAAVKLGYMEKGTAPVEVEVLPVTGVDDRRDTPLGSYRYLQLGAFGSAASAQRLQEELAGRVEAPVFVAPVQTGSDLLYRVRIGPMDNNETLLALQAELRASGYGSGQLLP